MRLPAADPHGAARRRFLLRCEALMHVWLWVLAGGIVMTAIGLRPSVLAVSGLLGILWVPIFLLIFWARLLDDTLWLRGDGNGGCR
jgi:hypothetical protein